MGSILTRNSDQCDMNPTHGRHFISIALGRRVEIMITTDLLVRCGTELKIVQMYRLTACLGITSASPSD
jgi:hypothetical protein